MIAYNEYDDMGTSTAVHYNSNYYDTADDATCYMPMPLNEREREIKENAEEATKTMALLSKNNLLSRSHRLNAPNTMAVRRVFKLLFSCSGKLSKRIRRIRKARG